MKKKRTSTDVYVRTGTTDTKGAKGPQKKKQPTNKKVHSLSNGSYEIEI